MVDVQVDRESGQIRVERAVVAASASVGASPQVIEVREGEVTRVELEAVPALPVDLAFELADPAASWSTIEVEIRGYNLALLERLGDTLVERMREIPGLTDIKSSTEGGNPELQVRFDRERLAALGLSLSDLASGLRAKVQGTIATDIQREDRTIDIRIRAANVRVVLCTVPSNLRSWVPNQSVFGAEVGVEYMEEEMARRSLLSVIIPSPRLSTCSSATQQTSCTGWRLCTVHWVETRVLAFWACWPPIRSTVSMANRARSCTCRRRRCPCPASSYSSPWTRFSRWT